MITYFIISIVIGFILTIIGSTMSIDRMRLLVKTNGLCGLIQICIAIIIAFVTNTVIWPISIVWSILDKLLYEKELES